MKVQMQRRMVTQVNRGVENVVLCGFRKFVTLKKYMLVLYTEIYRYEGKHGL